VARRGEIERAAGRAIWETSAVSTKHLTKQVEVFFVVGISTGVLAACSSHAASSMATTRPGTGELTIKTGPRLPQPKPRNW
jgi:hypothetical protein